jgi:hypothetical protein
MGVWAGPFVIAALLLAAAGVAKVVDPANAVGALRAFGVPVAPTVVRVVGAVEAVLAVSAVVTGAVVLAVAVGASYLLFTGFVVSALVRDLPIGSCGCFGEVDTPPSVLHVVVNLGAVAAALGVAVAGDGTGIGHVLAAQPLAGIPMVLLIVVGTYAAFTALTVVPQLAAARVERGHRP